MAFLDAKGRLVFEIVPEKGKLEEVVRALRPAQVPRAASGAINSTLSRVGSSRGLIVQTLRGILNVKAGDVADRILIKKASADHLEGSIRVSRKAMPLVVYGANQTKRGVTVRIRKSRGRELIPHAFLATMKSGHRGVFIRRKDYQHVRKTVPVMQFVGVVGRGQHAYVQTGTRRVVFGLPIDEVYGPTVVGVITGKPGAAEAIEAYASAYLTNRLDSQIQRFAAAQPVETE